MVGVSIVAIAFLLVVSFLAAMMASVEIGRALGHLAGARTRKRPTGLGTAEEAIFTLLGLLLALTFTGAAARFDARRALVAEEANAIGTAFLRIDLLPEDARPALRDDFRRYADLRLAAERAVPDFDAVQRNLDEAARMQQRIWADAVAACRAGEPQTQIVVLPAINAMIDITATRTAAARAHLPVPIYAFLCVISLVSGVFAGYEMGRSTARSLLHTVGYSLVLACTLYAILDFEYPRVGLIRLDDADRVLLDARRAMD